MSPHHPLSLLLAVESATRRRKWPARKTTKRIVFEPLEDRTVPSVDAVNIPSWNEQGPRPMISAQVNIPPDDQATGAVQSIAVNPDDPTQIYVGTVNGGIWRTDNVDPNDRCNHLDRLDRRVSLVGHWLDRV
jgi:hypothetical protein